MINVGELTQFPEDINVLEINLSSLVFFDTNIVNKFYDDLEYAVAETKKKWFFLICYKNCVIKPEAWSAFAARGKQLNQNYSLGSVRFGGSEELRSEIGASSKIEKFDHNLTATRDAALIRIGELREARKTSGETQTAPACSASADEFDRRITFDAEHDIMEVNLSDWTFSDSADVNFVFDRLERRLTATGRKWYIVVNYGGCQVFPPAWVAYAHRGKRLNIGFSLGTVRYDASSATASEIKQRAGEEKFDPNLCRSRKEAYRMVTDLRLSSQARRVAV